MAKSKDPALEKRRKAHIIETVHRLLVEGSHRTLTLDAVARHAGVSKGMVTYYFKTKDRLVAETIDCFLDRQSQMLQAIVRAPGPARARLERLIEAALPSGEELERQIHFQSEVWSFAKEVPAAREAIRASYLRFRQACKAMLAVGIEEGYVTAPDAEWIYLVLHALVDGLSVQIALDPSLDAAEVRGRVLDLMDDLLSGRLEGPRRLG